MKIKKVSLNSENIFIDIVLCPKTNLYLQSLYCHRCAYFTLDEENHINCNYKNPQINLIDHQKEELIKTFSEIKDIKENSSQGFKDNKANNEFMSNIDRFKTDLLKEIKKRKNSIKIL